LAYCKTDVPEFKPLDPYVIAQDHVEFPISTMQPTYFVAESFAKAKTQIIDYCENINSHSICLIIRSSTLLKLIEKSKLGQKFLRKMQVIWAVSIE